MVSHPNTEDASNSTSGANMGSLHDLKSECHLSAIPISSWAMSERDAKVALVPIPTRHRPNLGQTRGMSDSPHGAAASAVGYLYQVKWALLEVLRRAHDRPDHAISLEKLDDVAWEARGLPENFYNSSTTKPLRDRSAIRATTFGERCGRGWTR